MGFPMLPRHGWLQLETIAADRLRPRFSLSDCGWAVAAPRGNPGPASATVIRTVRMPGQDSGSKTLTCRRDKTEPSRALRDGSFGSRSG